MALRICLATDSRDPSGVGEHMLTLAGMLRDRFEIVVACPASPGGNAVLRRATDLGVGVRRLADAVATEIDWLRRSAFDLLHVHAGIGWEGHDLAAGGRQAGIASIVRTEHLPDLITDPVQRREHAAGLRLVDAVVCVSEAAARTFRAAGFDKPRLQVVSNGIGERPAARSRQSVRAALDADDGHRVALTTARFTPQKDHATLVRAWRIVVTENPAARLWLAGAGPLEGETRMLAESLGLTPTVRFLGNRDDVPDLLAGADVFVLPSLFEGLPLAVIEAMAAGLPVVATRVGGTDEVVIDGTTGRLVIPGDHEGIARAILQVFADPAEAVAHGAAGRARFRASFTAARMAEETADLYLTLGHAPGSNQEQRR